MSRTPDDGAIDLAPLLDLLFILAIFFWFNTLPVSASPAAFSMEPPVMRLEIEEMPRIVIQINAVGEVFLKGETTPIKPLFIRSRIEIALTNTPDAEFTIQAHPAANTYFVELVTSMVEKPSEGLSLH